MRQSRHTMRVCRAQAKPFSFQECDEQPLEQRAAAGLASTEIAETEAQRSAADHVAAPLPPSTAEPRYALLVADAQLRATCSAPSMQAQARLQEGAPLAGKHGLFDEVVEAKVVVPPHRPQTAKPKSTPGLATTLSSLPELDEGADAESPTVRGHGIAG